LNGKYNIEITFNYVKNKEAKSIQIKSQEFYILNQNPEPLDTIPPKISLSSPIENSFWNSSQVSVGYSVSDANFKEVEWNLNSGETEKACNSDSSFSIYAREGKNTLEFKAKDKQGNEAYLTRNFVVDKTNPAIEILYPEDGKIYSDSVNCFEYSVSDANLDSCWYSTDDEMAKNYLLDSAGTIKIKSHDGENVWKIHAKDKAKNQATKQVKFNIKKTNANEESRASGKSIEKILVYPNPFNEYLTAFGSNLFIQAYDLLGRKVYSGKGDNLKFGKDLPNGVYLLEINGQKRKVIKSK